MVRLYPPYMEVSSNSSAPPDHPGANKTMHMGQSSIYIYICVFHSFVLNKHASLGRPYYVLLLLNTCLYNIIEIFIYMYVCMYVCIYIYIYLYIYIYIYDCMQCINIYIYIYK